VSGLGERLMHGLELEGDLKDGSLSLRHVATHVGGGSSRGSLELDSRSAPPTLALTASAKGLDLGRLVEQIDANKAWSGALDAELDLRSRGGSAHALAAGLDGDAVLSCGGGTISTAHVGRFTRDLLRSVGRVVGVRRKSEVLNCLIVDVRFEKGRGTARTLVVDTKDVLIAGKGWVDLGDETLDLRLVPTPRRASPLSTAATVRVEGPLTSPAVKIEHTSLATSTTLAIVDNIKSFTGVRKAWGMLRGGASDQSPCAKLVGGGT
jgi:uncharacterized protein involved in outer membrane biogenesis